MNAQITNREIAGLVAGFGLWALALVVLYATHGAACSLGVRPDNWGTFTRILLAGIWAAMLLAHAWLITWFGRRLRAASDATALRFVRLVSFVLAIAALGATFWTGLPVLTLTICG